VSATDPIRISERSSAEHEPTLNELISRFHDAVRLEGGRARIAPAGTPSCAGCGCVRFLPSGQCSLCGAPEPTSEGRAQALDEWTISASSMQDIDLTHLCGYRVELFDAGRDRDDWPTVQKALDLIAAHDCPKESGMTIDQTERPEDAARRFALTLERVRALHARRDWFETDGDGVMQEDKPLPPFCDECSTQEFVTDVEDCTADQADGGMVLWPCQTMKIIDRG
jgi:hypothetical protein